MATKATARRPKKAAEPGENPLTFYPAWCKKCGICIAFCPKSVLEAGPGGQPFGARPEDCIRCHLCELRCPDFAVSVADQDQEVAA